MYGQESADSWGAQILHHATRRRYRGIAIPLVVLTLLFTIWICSDLVTGAIKQRPLSGFSFADSNGSHQTHTEEQEINGPQWATHNPKTNTGSLIPPKIWQILLPKKQTADDVIIDPDTLRDTPSWLVMNPDYTYTLVGHDGGSEFVKQHFPDDPSLIEMYNNLPNVGMQSDFLRYLILDVEGGVYTDIDTVALKAIDKWVPTDLRDKVRLIVGVEFDRRDGGGWADIPHWLQFCQWTIAAAPGHPIFRKMVTRIFQSLDDISVSHGVPVNKLTPTSFEVMNSTGPAAWTDVVFEALQEHDSSLKTTKDLSFMTKPRLYGDILVLTIDGFGMGQPHSHSTNDGSTPDAALMRHLFRGSWRGDSIEPDNGS
ncbi:uncharacterized protein TRUGW13939_00569 [Talaromyces rugulosus]|uniref:Initiation-specific alpha-1,6-mannosyltransferase n=1 Tax=Talaromyces rugulosus TaxID=121627 RepID=A0A7H8QHW0_TALRU|nr:uncharacterized protein TRUGW13939_00569 [Talaromyces rugulosus]QKX53490.1 hypothetical protein TRUGW13939_00569 [Talaromyces rugulosus]